MVLDTLLYPGFGNRLAKVIDYAQHICYTSTTMDVRAYTVNLPITVSSFAQHDLLKNKLLHLISECPVVPVTSRSEKISRSDWLVSKDTPREYFDIVGETILTDLRKVYAQFGSSDIRLINYWFQQYYDNDYHGWHVHPYVHLSSIYYLELPDNSIKTEFVDPITRKVFSIEVKEGDVITFPAQIPHRSPKNETGHRKTVIVLNTAIYELDNDLQDFIVK